MLCLKLNNIHTRRSLQSSSSLKVLSDLHSVFIESTFNLLVEHLILGVDVVYSCTLESAATTTVFLTLLFLSLDFVYLLII